MNEYLPILLICSIISVCLIAFTIVYIYSNKKKQTHRNDREMSDTEIIKRLAVYAKPYKKEFIGVFFILILSIAYDVTSPLLTGNIQKLVKADFMLSQLYARVAVYAGILVVSVVSTYLQAMILQKVGQKILSSIREDVYSHITSLSHNQLNNIPVGRLVTRVSNDPNSISFLFTNILVTLVKNTMFIFGVLGAMFVLNYAMTLIILSFVPVLIWFTIIFRRLSRRVHLAVNDATTDINTYLSENLSGIKITQIFNREKKKSDDFLYKSDVLRKARRNRMFVFGIFRPVVYMLYISAQLFLFYFGSRAYIKNQPLGGMIITGDLIVSFYMYISRFFNPIQALAEQFDMLQKSFAAAEKIFNITDMTPEIVDSPEAIEVEKIKGEIEFKDVWFSYIPDEWVLKGVSFHVLPGQTVAFVGSTGAGKTTILSLICRNYDIQKGQILIDGIDIKKIKISSLRSHFGQMLQDVFLFSGDIRSNIIMRKENVSDSEIWDACRYVNADSFIQKLESGLDEKVRERGNNFSAGQRQLLSFARTVIHKPDVMILDEATANIDTETEILIQDSLEKMKNIGTMLIVAHRLSTIRRADNIILLSHGEIKEQGTHNDLIDLKGKYYKLYTLQYQKQKIQSEI